MHAFAKKKHGPRDAEGTEHCPTEAIRPGGGGLMWFTRVLLQIYTDSPSAEGVLLVTPEKKTLVFVNGVES